MQRNSLSILLTAISLLLLSLSLEAQDPFPQFGIKKFGNSIAEPFHSGSNFRQNEQGKLFVDKYVYDGHQFVKHGIANPYGKLLTTDDRGGKWYKKDHFEVLYVHSDTSISFNTKAYFKYDVNSVYRYEQEVYLVTNLGAIQYHQDGNDLTYIRSIPVSDEEIWTMHRFQDTLFFKSLNQSIFIQEADLSKETAYGPEDLSNFNNAIIYLPNNRILLKGPGYEKELAASHPHYKVIRDAGDKIIIKHLVDRKGRLWLTLRGNGRSGLFCAAANSSQLKNLDLGIEKSVFLTSLFEDKEGNIWVGSGGQGIVQLYESQFQVLGKEFGLSSDNIWSVSQDKQGKIYFSASCGGIDILSPNGTLEHMMGTACQEALYHDSKGNFWINTQGLTKIDSSGQLTNYQKGDGLVSRSTKVILEDSKGTIWVGTRKAIHKYDGKKLIPYVVEGIAEFDRVTAMQEIREGRFILAFGSGKIFTFDGLSFSPVPSENQGVNSIFKDLDGTIWVAMAQGDLYILNQQGALVKANTNSQLKDVHMLQDDRLGKMWGICSGNRLFSFNKENYLQQATDPALRYYTINDGVPLIASNNDIQPTTKLLQDGRIIFPNIHGAILIDPTKELLPPTSYHTEIISEGKVVQDKLALQYGQNDLALEIKAIVLANNKTIKYQYKLNEEWLDVPTDGKLSLNNLPHGDNAIAFRSGIPNAQWQAVPLLTVHVPPLFYQRIIFWLAVALALGALMFFIIKNRTKLINQRNALLKEKVDEQTEALEKEKQQLSASLKTQKQLTQELNLTQAAKNRMYAQISHEFRSPLQAIKANLNHGDGTLIVENHKRISANINNLLNISNEILELSKAESGQLKAKKNWYNINGIIREQINLIRPLADKKNIELSFQCEVENYYLSIDISLIQKVINNLLSNAIKFSARDTVIQVTSRAENDQQLIAVIDRGIGITAEDISKLTLPYYQAVGTSLSGSGTGIGLSLVAQILKLHDSELEIKSKEKLGSTFAFRLSHPTISQAEIAQQFIDLTDIDSQITAVSETQKPIILAVDDSPDVLFFIEQTLTPFYHIVKVNNGQSALQLLDKIEPAVIISDVNMPILNGMEFLIAVRNIPKYKAIPFLFLTGSLSEDTELRSIKAGADFVLQKPIQEEYLISRLQQMLHKQQNLMEKVKSSFAHQLLPKNIHNDDLFLMNQLEKVILDNLSNNKLRSEDIANLLGLGEKTLRNRVKNISGLTLKKYLRCIRLEKAKLLIEEEYGNLGEIAVATGFSSLSYFSKAYKAYFDNK